MQRRSLLSALALGRSLVGNSAATATHSWLPASQAAARCFSAQPSPDELGSSATVSPHTLAAACRGARRLPGAACQPTGHLGHSAASLETAAAGH